MTAIILDGRALSKELFSKTTTEVRRFVDQYARVPELATVLVGDDPASRTYVKMKGNRCAEVGMRSRKVQLEASISTQDLIDELRTLSESPAVDGILLQHPVPDHIDERAAFEAIPPHKDVDGVTRISFSTMAFGEEGVLSATPGGIMALLHHYAVPLTGKRAVVVGRSAILGWPVGMLLLNRDATVTYCHSRTADLAEHIRAADIVVAAAGKPELIKGEWIKPGAAVIDAGYADNVGDVEFDGAAKRAGFITPVPGGVGPMTIATLIAQTITAAFRSEKARQAA